MKLVSAVSFFFFFNDTATTEIYTLSLHDALPISKCEVSEDSFRETFSRGTGPNGARSAADRKSTRLNSSHQIISYAVFCLKKKKKQILYNYCGKSQRHVKKLISDRCV